MKEDPRASEFPKPITQTEELSHRKIFVKVCLRVMLKLLVEIRGNVSSDILFVELLGRLDQAFRETFPNASEDVIGEFKNSLWSAFSKDEKISVTDRVLLQEKIFPKGDEPAMFSITVPTQKNLKRRMRK